MHKRSKGYENTSKTLNFFVLPLAQDELERSVDLAKTFKYDTTRANATLAIARAILEKPATKLQDQ